MLIAFVLPAAVLWRRAHSGFRPVGYDPAQPETIQRARNIAFAGPIAVFFYFAYLAQAAQQIETTLLYGACTILIAVSQQWLYYRLRRIERAAHRTETEDDPTAVGSEAPSTSAPR